MKDAFDIVTLCDHCNRRIYRDEVYYECRLGSVTATLCDSCVELQRNGEPYKHGRLVDEADVFCYMTNRIDKFSCDTERDYALLSEMPFEICEEIHVPTIMSEVN